MVFVILQRKLTHGSFCKQNRYKIYVSFSNKKKSIILMKRIIGSRGMKETAPIVTAPVCQINITRRGKRHGSVLVC